MIYSKLPRPFFVLAPMFDVTDTVFRQVIATLPYSSHLDEAQGASEQRTEGYREYPEGAAELATQRFAKNTSKVASSASEQAGVVRKYGPDLYVTEFVNVDGLQSIGRNNLLKYLKFTDAERPLIAQIWGKTPENFYKTAQQLVEMGFDGIDINMGCPDKSITANGCCAALINNRELAAEIIEATQKGAGDLPVSVKTRLGFNDIDLSWHEFLLGKNLKALTIHGRTKKEMSKVPPHWDAVGEIVKLRDKLAPDTLIIGNGDILSRAEGKALSAKYNLDGVMLGRAVFTDPFVFADKSPWMDYTKQQRLDLYKKHVQLFADAWQNGERKVHTLNKFCKVYIQGFDGAKELREKLMAATTTDELTRILTDASA